MSCLSSQSFRSLVLVLLLLFTLAVPAPAEDDFVTYPPLPGHYRSIKVYDRSGQYVGRILPEQRYWTPLARIPTFLQQAVVAIEDSRFYEHGGIDLRGIARALVKDVVKGSLVEGGSTITQQLIKNKLLSGEKTIDRKLKEGYLALEYERKYSKQQILEMYFNEIYFGNGAWGIAQAARIYFDKNPEELNESECAILAGTPKNPGRYNPAGEAKAVAGRRDVVLKRMEELGMIDARRKEEVRSRKVTTAKRSQAPSYLAHVRAKLVERLGPQTIVEGGLTVTAALDLNLQLKAEQALVEGMKKLAPDLQGALVSLDVASGDVVAAVGGVDFAKSNYNRALYARRQPGSAIKPLIYALAVERGITAASLWDDTPVAYPRGDGHTWTPRNYRRESFGQLSLRQALAHSNNVITVKLLDTLGVGDFVDFAGRLGLPLQARDLSLALGTEDVTLVELAQAYTALAGGGLRSEARTIIRIVDQRHNDVIEYEPLVTAVMSPAAAYVTTRMLQDVMDYGTAKSLAGFRSQRPSAGKTGTTDDYRDAWFVGYTPQLVTGVWVGHDQPRPEGKGFTGGAVAAPVWERFMRRALADVAPDDFMQPPDVVLTTIDPATGALANSDCPTPRDEYFVVANAPTTPCAAHGGAPLPQPLPPDWGPPAPATLPAIPENSPAVPAVLPPVTAPVASP